MNMFDSRPPPVCVCVCVCVLHKYNGTCWVLGMRAVTVNLNKFRLNHCSLCSSEQHGVK